MKSELKRQSCLTELSPAATGPRRMLRATDRDGGVFYFSPDQVASLTPLRDGGSCVRLRAGRWILLPWDTDRVADVLWATAPAKVA